MQGSAARPLVRCPCAGSGERSCDCKLVGMLHHVMLSLAFALGQKLCRTLRRISVHSPPMRATFSATERFIKKNDEHTASITPGNKKSRPLSRIAGWT